MNQSSFSLAPLISLTTLTANDEPFLAEMMYQAIFVPAGAVAPPRSVVTEPTLSKYYVSFGTRIGDIGLKAIAPPQNISVGAAWVRLFTRVAPGYGYINDETPELSIAIDPAYRSKGIGTLLLTQLFATVAEQYNAISLSVWTENPAYRLYERLGFTVIKGEGIKNEGIKNEEDDPAVTMCKWLM